MEDALVREGWHKLRNLQSGLNPCFNGRCTRTSMQILVVVFLVCVLILVLMEDALVLS